MKAFRLLETASVIAILAFAVVAFAESSPTSDNSKIFLDLTAHALGVRIQVNATAETRPDGNISASLTLYGLTDVYIEHFNLSIYGFLNGTEKLLIGSIGSRADEGFWLNDTSRLFESPVPVPDDVWGVAYGEVALTHKAYYGPTTMNNDGLSFGFAMTNVENARMEDLEEQVKDLNVTNQQLSTTVEQLNQNVIELQKNLSALQGNAGDTYNTRTVAIVLGVTTAFFVAVTLYLMFRRPKNPW